MSDDNKCNVKYVSNSMGPLSLAGALLLTGVAGYFVPGILLL